jgi:hypothetical protein
MDIGDECPQKQTLLQLMQKKCFILSAKNVWEIALKQLAF